MLYLLCFTLCMLAYYHTKISISLQHFDHTICEGVIAHFYFEEYFIKTRPNFSIGIPQTLHACLLKYRDSHIVKAVCKTIFEGIMAHFDLQYFIKKLVLSTPTF